MIRGDARGADFSINRELAGDRSHQLQLVGCAL
jgi:hypothetical protein